MGGIVAKLSNRQKQIVVLLTQGRSQKAAARQLGVSPSTVRSHLRVARQKAGCQSSLELAIKVYAELHE